MATIAADKVRLGLRSSGLPMSAEEFDDLPRSCFDRRYRYEIINGVLVVTPFPGNGELDPNEELGHLLRSYNETDPRGSVLNKTLNEQTIPAMINRRRCDRAIWIGLGRVPDIEKDIPAIVIEFVSRSRRDFLRDYEIKRAEYLSLAVREYWIIDRFRRIITIHRNRPEGVSSLIIGEAESYQTELLPGFVLPLARLLHRADDWPVKRKPRRKPPEGDPR